MTNCHKNNKPKIISVTGGKGGVGKTALSVCLAHALTLQGKEVAIFDADLGLSNVDVCLGIKPKYDLADLLFNMVPFDDYVVNTEQGFRLLPGASGVPEINAMSALEQSGLIAAFSEHLSSLDYLIIDTAAGISSNVLNFMHLSDLVLMVLTPDPSSLTDSYALIKLLSKQDSKLPINIITNQARDEAESQRCFNRLQMVCNNFLDKNLTLSGGIEYSDYVRRCTSRQKTIFDCYPNSPTANSIRLIANNLQRSEALKSRSSGKVHLFDEAI